MRHGGERLRATKVSLRCGIQPQNKTVVHRRLCGGANGEERKTSERKNGESFHGWKNDGQESAMDGRGCGVSLSFGSRKLRLQTREEPQRRAPECLVGRE